MFKFKNIFLISIFLLLLFFMITPASCDEQRLVFTQSWLKGVVIIVYGNQYGTGFWINPTHVATAAHVVSYDSNARVTIIRGNKQSQGQVVALDRSSDVAIVFVNNADQFDKHVFPIARSMPQQTSVIYVIGYPHELYQILGSLEELSENPRVLESRLTWTASGLIELGGITDAGNSGGPVLDYSGNVIGIVSFALRGEAGTLYFATSAGNLKQLCVEHNIAFTEGTSGIIPEQFVQNPATLGAISGALASIVVDIVLIVVGMGIGIAVIAKRKRGRK